MSASHWINSNSSKQSKQWNWIGRWCESSWHFAADTSIRIVVPLIYLPISFFLISTFVVCVIFRKMFWMVSHDVHQAISEIVFQTLGAFLLMSPCGQARIGLRVFCIIFVWFSRCCWTCWPALYCWATFWPKKLNPARTHWSCWLNRRFRYASRKNWIRPHQNGHGSWSKWHLALRTARGDCEN